MSRPTLLAGFSFGAAVGLRAACGDARVPGLIALGLPVHAAGRYYTYGFLGSCAQPKLFLSGDHDQFAPRQLLEEVFAHVALPKRIAFIDGAEHFFQGTSASPGAKLNRMQAEMRSWLSETFQLS